MSLNILRPGLLTTVQDLGRFGYQRDGIIVSGALDAPALRVANLLVGNAEDAAGLEITLLGPRIRFETDHLIKMQPWGGYTRHNRIWQRRTSLLDGMTAEALLLKITRS